MKSDRCYVDTTHDQASFIKEATKISHTQFQVVIIENKSSKYYIYIYIYIHTYIYIWGQSRQPCSLRRMSVAARVLGLPVWFPLRPLMFISCVSFVGSGLFDKLVTRSEEFYRVCVCVCVCVCARLRVCLIACNLQTSTTRMRGNERGYYAT